MNLVEPDDGEEAVERPVDLPTLEKAAEEAVAHPGRARDFVLFAAAQCISSVGSWMQKTAFGWLTWELTHSVAWVGAMGLADIVALLWVAPLSGPLTDRSNPFRLLSITQSALLALSASLCLCIATGYLTIWTLWLFALVESTLQGFNQPVRMTATRLLAGKERVSQAVATNSIGMNTARSIGPMIGGIVLARWGAAPVLGIDSVSFVAMLAAIWTLRRRLDRPGAAAKAPLGIAIIGSARSVFSDRAVAPVLLLVASFSFFARPFFEMLPAFAGKVFGGDPHVLASLLSAQGIAALGGAVFMLRRRGDRGLAICAVTAGLVLAIAIAAFACTGTLAIALPLMCVAGLGHVICNISIQSLLQVRARREIQGQVLSFFSLMFRTGPSIGALAIGFAATVWGLQDVMIVCAIIGGLLFVAFGRNLLRPAPASAAL